MCIKVSRLGSRPFKDVKANIGFSLFSCNLDIQTKHIIMRKILDYWDLCFTVLIFQACSHP